MITKAKSYTQSEITQILVCNLPEWRRVDQDSIKLTRLAGLTNVTYKAELQNKTEIPSTVIFRQFGEAEGFVDKDQERFIFKEIGDMDLGPKELASGPNWRIEEFIQDGVHPNSTQQMEPMFQFNLMGVIQSFHALDVPLPNKETSTMIEKVFSQEMKYNVIKKICFDNIYNDEELEVLQEIKEIVENEEEQNLLKSFVENDQNDKYQEELAFCHNDLNQLNIFFTPNPKREIVLIDYEYCSYNYPSYDIANFLNESSIDYQHPQDPFYSVVQENKCGPVELHYIVLCYLIYQLLKEDKMLIVKKLLEQFPEVNKDQEELDIFQSQVEDILRHTFKSDMVVKELREKIKFLKKRIRRFQIISNYNWTLWCVLQAHKPDSDFDYIKYGQMRLDLYKEQLHREKMKLNKQNKLKEQHRSDEEEDPRTTSSDSDNFQD